jgi:hypothetical protein
LSPDQVSALELLEKARKTGAAKDADAAMSAMRTVTAHDPTAGGFRVLFPMALGRIDDAFGPEAAPIAHADRGVLYLAPTARLRRDGRYWPLAAREGLVHYWLTTNKWPDFCRDPTYPLDCRAQARRVAAIGPA